MNPDELEQKISRQPLRTLPSAWRGEILAAASKVQLPRHASCSTRHSFLSTLNSQLSAFLWPHPKAWAGLAAVWIFIGALNFSTRDTSPRLAEKSLPPSPEVIVELKKQQRLFAELVGSHETVDAERPRIFLPRPRSGRGEFLAA
jgi:hypothetical protein